MKIKKLLLLFITVTVLGSCNEDHFLNKVVLEKIVYHENVDQIGLFAYNSDGELQEYQYYFDNKLDEIIEYDYSDGSLSSKRYYTKTNSTDDVPDFLEQEQLFVYKPSNELARAYLHYKLNDNVVKYSYTWSGGNATKVTMEDDEEPFTESFDDMQYDTRGNIIKRLHYVLTDDEFTLNYIIDYEYDTKRNPLFDLKDPIDLLTSTPKNIGPNNVVRATQRSAEGADPHSITEIEYTYTEFDFPEVKTEVTTLNGNESESTTKFFYKKI